MQLHSSSQRVRSVMLPHPHPHEHQEVYVQVDWTQRAGLWLSGPHKSISGLLLDRCKQMTVWTDLLFPLGTIVSHGVVIIPSMVLSSGVWFLDRVAAHCLFFLVWKTCLSSC